MDGHSHQSLRVVIYVNARCDAPLGQDREVERQLVTMRARVAARGDSVYQEFVDRSDLRSNQKRYNAMISMAKKPEVDAVAMMTSILLNDRDLYIRVNRDLKTLRTRKVELILFKDW